MSTNKNTRPTTLSNGASVCAWAPLRLGDAVAMCEYEGELVVWFVRHDGLATQGAYFSIDDQQSALKEFYRRALGW